jgi:DNA-binding winged helix-turn-helix (wHTH) protein
MPETTPPRRFRFGVFEADAATGELRKQGIRIKLNVQPFQILVMLLERPGEILTREQIARELWPEGTFVDYEHGVNSAVNRIRDALGDRARNPRFIETLARRGYRFVAPVQRLGGEATIQPAPQITAASEPIPPPIPALQSRFLAAPDELPKVPHRIVQNLFLGLQLMYLGFYVGALANLPEIQELMAGLSRPAESYAVLVATAALLIPVRVFLITAVTMHAPGFRSRYLRLWPFVLPFDILWALSPFLLLHHIDIGVALACMAPLVYAPFAQRSLILMGAGQAGSSAAP